MGISPKGPRDISVCPVSHPDRESWTNIENNSAVLLLPHLDHLLDLALPVVEGLQGTVHGSD